MLFLLDADICVKVATNMEKIKELNHFFLRFNSLKY